MYNLHLLRGSKCKHSNSSRRRKCAHTCKPNWSQFMPISAKCRRTLGWSLTDWRDPKHVPTAAEGVLRKARNPHDSALRQIAFIGFPKEASAAARVAAMDRFMTQHLLSVQVKHIDVSFNRSESRLRGCGFQAACAFGDIYDEEHVLRSPRV